MLLNANTQNIMTITRTEATERLQAIRKERKPNVRGVMLLTAFLANLMLQFGTLNEEKMNLAELLFWLDHNGDGTEITAEHRTHRTQ